MKKIFVVFGLVLSIAAQASEMSPISGVIRGVAQRLLARRALSGQPLLHIEGSSAVPQGSEYNLFVKTVTSYEESYVVLDATLDGNPVSLDHPAKDMWIYSAPEFEAVRDHVLNFTVSLEDAAQADKLSQSLAATQQKILSLQDQISNTTDPNQLAQLNALLNQQIALQSQLTTSLMNLKNPIGTQSFNFSVSPAPSNSATFPSITSVSPAIGATSGGTSISIAGTNFVNGATVSIGGVAAINVSVVNSTTISATTPAFASDGIKDVAVTLPLGAGDMEQKNAVKNGAFYSSSVLSGGINIPVAVAGATQAFTLGAPATLDGSQSVGPAGHGLAYAWSLISKPSQSSLPTGTTIANSVTTTVSPDFPGSYVYKLLVSDTVTNTVSSPSLTVVTANLGSTSLSASAPAIAVMANGSATSQVSISDTNAPYLTFNYYITQQPFFGGASVSPSGLITYTESAPFSSSTSADQFGVTIIDSQQHSFSFTVPVTISASTAPSSAPAGPCNYSSNGFPVSVTCPVGQISAPNGSLSSVSFDFGDGSPLASALSANSAGNLSASGGYHLHTFSQAGNYFIRMKLVDNLGIATNATQLLRLQGDAIPVTKFTLNSISGAAPFAVTADATATSTSSNTPLWFNWSWGDGSSNYGSGPSFTTISHTYSSPGTYSISVSVTDGFNAISFGSATVYVGVTAPATGSPPYSFPNVPNPVGLVNSPVTFDGATYSFDANPQGSIASYAWNILDFTGCQGGCTSTAATTTHAFANPGTYYAILMVTNALGGQSSYSPVKVFIVNRGLPPQPEFSMNAQSGAIPQTIAFDASASYDSDGTITNYSWNWGDGSADAAGKMASHTYSTSGLYFSTLTVTDDDGNLNSASALVSVAPSPVFTPMNASPAPSNEVELVNACAAGIGSACSDLGDIYLARGDTFTGHALKAKACTLGYKPACSGREQ